MIMLSALTEYKLKASEPEVLLRPKLPSDITLFSGYSRAQEAIAAGEKAADDALPQIKMLLQR